MNFKKGLQIPLFKGGGKDQMDTDNHRGITLQCVYAKVFDKVILKRLDPWMEEHMPLNELQGAAHKQCSSIGTSFVLQEAIAQNKEAGHKVYIAFFDVKKAFDTVWLDGLFYKLYKKGMKGKLWRILINSYTGCMNYVKVDGNNSSWFPVKQGVKQGGVLSMKLYQIYIDDLLNEMRSLNVGSVVNSIDCTCPAFADDITAITLYKSCLVKLLKTAYEYSCKWRFCFNVAKCAILVLGESETQRSSRRLREKFYLGNEQVKERNEYTHVGIPINVNGESCTAIEESVSKGRRKFYSVVGSSVGQSGLVPETLSKVYWSVCIPTILYGAEVGVFTEKEMKILETAHCNMAKTIQGIPKNTPSPACLATLGWENMTAFVDLKQLAFFWHLISLKSENIYRKLFVCRFVNIVSNGVNCRSKSIVGRIVRLCYKYDLMDIVNDLLFKPSYNHMSKLTWKNLCKEKVYQYHYSVWRFILRFYQKLALYRIIHTKNSMSCWWKLAGEYPARVYKCRLMIKLVTGMNALNVYSNTSVSRNKRMCTLCDIDDVESVCHFVLRCSFNAILRESMFDMIERSISNEAYHTFISLSENIKLYVMLGMDYPFQSKDIKYIQIISADYVWLMYHKRNKHMYGVDPS